MTKNKANIRLEHFQNLIAIAYADGVLKDNEKEFLFQRAKQFDISDEDIQKSIDNAANLNFLLPSEYGSSLEQLTDIIFIALIDGDLHKREYATCLRIAENLKLTKTDLDNTLSLIKTLWS